MAFLGSGNCYNASRDCEAVLCVCVWRCGMCRMAVLWASADGAPFATVGHAQLDVGLDPLAGPLRPLLSHCYYTAPPSSLRAGRARRIYPSDADGSWPFLNTSSSYCSLSFADLQSTAFCVKARGNATISGAVPDWLSSFGIQMLSAKSDGPLLLALPVATANAAPKFVGGLLFLLIVYSPERERVCARNPTVASIEPRHCGRLQYF